MEELLKAAGEFRKFYGDDLEPDFGEPDHGELLRELLKQTLSYTKCHRLVQPATVGANGVIEKIGPPIVVEDLGKLPESDYFDHFAFRPHLILWPAGADICCVPHAEDLAKDALIIHKHWGVAHVDNRPDRVFYIFVSIDPAKRHEKGMANP